MHFIIVVKEAEQRRSQPGCSTHSSIFFLHPRVSETWGGRNCDTSIHHRSMSRVLPAFFKLILEPNENTLGIPPQFMEHFGHHLSKMVVLKVPGGPAMEVKLVRSYGKAWLGRGWKEFREQYSLEFGFFLTFDYKGNSEFHVIIFDLNSVRRGYALTSNHLLVDLDKEDDEENVPSDEASGCQEKAEEAEDDDSVEMLENPRSRTNSLCLPVNCRVAYEKAIAFRADHTSSALFFIAPMQHYYVSKPFVLFVPKSFANENIPSDGFVTLRIENGKNWPVKYCGVMGKRPRPRLSSGWKNFIQDNVINAGDACIFEVDKGNKIVWNVTIFRQY